MFWVTSVACILYFINLINAVSVRIDGMIDLGPRWSYEYKVVMTTKQQSGAPKTTPRPHKIPTTSRTNHRFTRIERFHEEFEAKSEATTKANLKMIIQDNKHRNTINVIDKINSNVIHKDRSNVKGEIVINLTTVNVTTRNITRTKDKLVTLEDYNNNIFSKSRMIKEDAQINSFTTHIFKQTLKVFEALKRKINDYRIKKQVDFLSRNYETKFKEFIKESRKHKIKSRLGTQKVILNTIDVSNRILTRLVNYLIADMEKKGILRHNLAIAQIFQKEVDKETSLEYNHACTKHGICRTSQSSSNLVLELIDILMRTDNTKFKLAMDAFTEAFKNAEFTNKLNELTIKKMKKAVEAFEDAEVFLTRGILMIIQNIIKNKNQPLIIHNRVSARINQTLAMLELFDIFDKRMPDEASILESTDLKKSLQQWAEGKRNDIQELMETFVNMFKKALESLDAKTLKRIDNIINIIL